MANTVRFFLIPVLGETREIHTQCVGRFRDWMRPHIKEFFDEDVEHVAVLYDGQRRDMFVGETSSINGRHIRNVRATEIYRAATIQRAEQGETFDPQHLMWVDDPPYLQFNPESLPAISGPAILFPDKIVWT